MSFAIASRFSDYFLSYPRSLYAKAIHFTKKFVSPAKINKIEAIIAGTSVCFFSALLDPPYETPVRYILLKAAILPALVVGVRSCFKVYEKYFKIPFIRNEIQNSIKASETNFPSMLMWRSTDDWNEASLTYAAMDNYEKLSKKFSIDLLEVDSDAELQAVLESNQKNYDRIDFDAHADQNGILLSRQIHLNRNSTVILQWLNEKIKFRGIFVLNCCSAGQGEENIAWDLSRACPSATVFASGGVIDDNFPMELDEEARPSFSQFDYYKIHDITRIYQNGVLVNPS